MTDHDLLAQLAAELNEATTYTIPCITSRPYGRIPRLTVQVRLDGHGDGWAILDADDHAWTGTTWRHITTLAASEIYRYTRRDALDEAHRLAPLHAQATAIVRPTTPGYREALAAADAQKGPRRG
jgi:hypothetical protein